MSLRLAPTALALALGLTAVAHARDFNFTTNIDHDKPTLTCADIEMSFWTGRKGSDDVVTVRQERAIPLASLGARPLRVRAADHGGVRVQRTPDAKASGFVCLAAGAESEAAANAILEKVRVVSEGGELSVTGPDDERWAAYIILSVPREAHLEMTAGNGELALRGVSGRFALRTTNGPISVVDVAGEVACEAVNGPIRYRGHEGDVRLTAQNGPVSVQLDAATWSGTGLDASTQNGPVQLSAPADLKSGVRVEGSRHSPVQWKRTGRSRAEGWSRDHTIRLGDGPVKVRLSTVNGPVEVKGPSASAEGVDI